MKAFIRILLILAALGIVSCGGSSSKTPPNIAFAYIIGQGQNSIGGLGEQPGGTLVPLSVATFTTLPRPVAMALHPSKNFLYVANHDANTVSGFSIDHTSGVLAPIGTALSPNPVGVNPIGVAAASGGGFLYVLNQGTTTVAPSISAFAIDPVRGFLTQIAGSPFPAPASSQFIVASPSSGFFFISTGTSISAFAVGADGTPSSVAGSPFAGAAGANITGMTVEPKGQFLFAADTANNQISSFSIQAGALTLLGSTSVSPATQPVAVAVDSTSTFLYSANQGSNNVSAFKLSSGTLTPVNGSPFASGPGGATADQPVFLTVDATNGLLYVANSGSKTLGEFTINPADGSLIPIPSSPVIVQAQPLWIISTK